MTGSKGTSTVPSKGKAQRSYWTGINPSLHYLALRKHGSGRTICLPNLGRDLTDDSSIGTPEAVLWRERLKAGLYPTLFIPPISSLSFS